MAIKYGYKWVSVIFNLHYWICSDGQDIRVHAYRMEETLPIEHTSSETDDESGGSVMAAVRDQEKS